MSTAGTILSNIAVQLRAVTGTYSLAGTVTRIGRPTQSEATFGVHIWGLQVASTREGASLGQWRRDFEVRISGYLGPKVVGAEARVLAAANLSADIHLAIESDPSLGGAVPLGGPVRDMTITDSLIETEQGVQGVEVVLTGDFRSSAGGV